MHLKKIGLCLLTLITVGNAPSVLGQTTIYETTRFGPNNAAGSNNGDFVLNNFSATLASPFSSAPGRPSTSASSRFATTPATGSTSAVLTPGAGAVGGSLVNGSTYAVAVTFPNNATASQHEATDPVINDTDTGTTGLDTFAGLTPAFQSAYGTNVWITIGYVTLNSSTPTFTFTWSSGANVDRWYVDAIRFMPVNMGTPQFWDTGSLGGSGTWDTMAAEWNTAADGSGSQQAYVQAGLADFRGTAGTVTIAAGGVISDGGVEFDVTGYTLAGAPLTLGSGSTAGTNIFLTGGTTANLNCVLTGNNGMNIMGGIANLGATETVAGTVTLSGGIVQLQPGVSQTFYGLAGDSQLALGANTLTINGNSTSNAFYGVISDGGTASPGAVVITGAGIVTLADTNVFAGKVTVNGGTLGISSDSSLGAVPSAYVANQLTLNGNGSSFGNALGSGFPTINAKRGITLIGSNIIAPLVIGNREITLNSPIVGTGSLMIPTGSPDFNATNTFAGDLFFQLTNNLSARFNTNNSAGMGTIHVMPLTSSGTACTLRNFSPNGITTTIPNPIFFDESVSHAQNYNFDTANTTGTFVLSGNISGMTTGGMDINDNPNGKGNVVLSGANGAFSGGFNLMGGTLTLGSPTALGTGWLVVEESFTTPLSSTMTLQASIPLTGASAITNTVYLNAPSSISSFVLQGANSMQFSGPVHIGALGGAGIAASNTVPATIAGIIDDEGLNQGLTTSGSGTLVLGGANTYTAGTIVTSGTLDVNATGSIIGAVTVSGGTLELDNVSAMPSPSVTVSSPGVIYLNYSGTQNIGSLTVNGVPATPGTWGSPTSSALNQTSDFTGNGILNVAGTVSSVSVSQASGSSPSTYGSPVSFSASVTGSSPTGSVQFYVNGIALGTPVALISGSATSITTLTIGAGAGNVTAYYLGDANNSPAIGTLSPALTINPLPAVLQEYYNGTTTATVANLSVANTIGSDVVPLTGGPLTLAGATIGVQSIVTGTVSSSNPNYAAAGATTVTINPLPVILTGTRAYDGTGTASASILSVSNKVVGDDVSVDPSSGNATLASASVGSESITSPGSLALLGVTATNYTLAGAGGAVVITNAFNAFTITNAYLDATKTNLVVCWQSVPGVVYHVLTNTGLGNGAWVDVGSPVSPTVAVPTNSFCATIPGATNTNTFVLIKQ